MIRPLMHLALAAGTLLVWPKHAEAAESYDSCTGFINSLPATISTQGTWCLKTNLSTDATSGSAITIATNNVTLDCNHFRIDSSAFSTRTYTVGIEAWSRFNVTVRNCSIRGFNKGINFNGIGGGHLVEDSRFDDNATYGIEINGAPGSTIRNNQVFDTNSSMTNTIMAFGIKAADGVDVINNTVGGTAGKTSYGIYTSSNDMGVVVGNRVWAAADFPGGIYDASSDGTVISRNIVQGPGQGADFGIYCGNPSSIAHDNMVLGYGADTTHTSGPVRGCVDSANSVNPN